MLVHVGELSPQAASPSQPLGCPGLPNPHYIHCSTFTQVKAACLAVLQGRRQDPPHSCYLLPLAPLQHTPIGVPPCIEDLLQTFVPFSTRRGSSFSSPLSWWILSDKDGGRI